MIYQYSTMGARHAASGGDNEDALSFGENGRFAAVTLADGVSACQAARAGAVRASEVLKKMLLDKGAGLFDFSGRQIAEVTLSHILYHLERLADKSGGTVEDYSSTISGVLFDRWEDRLLLVNVGDGMILAQGSCGSRILAMPCESSEGCCVTTTRNACVVATAKVMTVDGLDSVLICSDGAWRHLFEGTGLGPEAAALLSGEDWCGLAAYLDGQNCQDDCSFIALSLKQM